jgi:predicted nucleic acid-binding protein
MKEKDQVKTSLVNCFGKKHTEASFDHYLKAIEKFQQEDWEQSLVKVGKFVEAVLKCLCLFCKQPLPPARQFKVPRIVSVLEQQTTADDSMRLSIPRACVFVYDIACNRGARHDPQEINANKMDATVAVSVSSWIVAELVRFAEKGKSSPDLAAGLVEALIEKQVPYFEEIDGRIYVNLKNLSAPDIGLLLLYRIYPQRISKKDLIEQIMRHQINEATARVAVSRLAKYVDDLDNNLKIRGIGRQRAITILTNGKRS